MARLLPVPAGRSLSAGCRARRRAVFPAGVPCPAGSAALRGLFAVTVLDEVFEAETAGVLLPPVQRPTPAEPLREFVAANGACVLNTAFSAAFSVLERWHRKRTQAAARHARRGLAMWAARCCWR